MYRINNWTIKTLWVCPECGGEFENLTNYCPNCGEQLIIEKKEEGDEEEDE